MNRVRVVPYNHQWPHAYAVASAEVIAAMGGILVEIHHIGSTAIPGIYAKPIVDMLVVVSDISITDQQTPQMQAIGYEAMGEFGIRGRRYFRRDNAAGERTEQVHAFGIDSPDVERHLAFRNFLRAHGEIAFQYSELKRKLAKAHPDDISAYMDGKHDFIRDVESKALEWLKGSLGNNGLRNEYRCS